MPTDHSARYGVGAPSDEASSIAFVGQIECFGMLPEDAERCLLGEDRRESGAWVSLEQGA